MKWILVFLVVFGDFLIIRKKRIGFYLWVFADSYFAFSCFQNENIPESVVFGLYAVMGIYGLYLWKTGDKCVTK